MRPSWTLLSPPGFVSCTCLGMLSVLQVTRLQYLNALLATRAQSLPQSPENTDLQVIPGSQTRLLGDKTATAAGEPRKATSLGVAAQRAGMSFAAPCRSHTHSLCPHSALCFSFLVPFSAHPSLFLFSLFLVAPVTVHHRPAGIESMFSQHFLWRTVRMGCLS